MDETYIKVKGAWKYLYCAVDKEEKTVDFLLTARCDKAAVLRFFDKAIKANGLPEKITMDKSGANKVAIDKSRLCRIKQFLSSNDVGFIEDFLVTIA